MNVGDLIYCKNKYDMKRTIKDLEAFGIKAVQIDEWVLEITEVTE